MMEIEPAEAREMFRIIRDMEKRISRLEVEAKGNDLLWRDHMEKGPQPDSDGWIPWHGGECPVEEGTPVDVKYRDGDVGFYKRAGVQKSLGEERSAVNWHHYGFDDDIIAYRPAKQEAEWPQVGDRVWVIDAGMCVWAFFWDGGETDRVFQDFLGIYPTREQAEAAAEKIKRVMDHWRAGKAVVLEDVYPHERIKL